MNKTISELFDYGDGDFIEPAEGLFDPEEIRAMTMKKLHPEGRGGRRLLRQTTRTLLLAAVITALLTVTALAAGLSLHRQRQAEIRQQLSVEENRLEHYEEYAVPEETDTPTVGITLLAAYNDGEMQRVYVNVSPVSEEMLMDEGWPAEEGTAERYVFSSSVGDGWSPASIFTREWDFPEEDMEEKRYPDGVTVQVPTREAIYRKYLDQAYDPETRTLTLCCVVSNHQVTIGQPVDLFIRCDGFTVDAEGRWLSYTTVQDYGSVRFTPVERDEARTLRFPEPIAFTNPETGGRGRILAIEIYPTGVDWLYEYDGAERIFARDKVFADEQERLAYQRFEQSWLLAVEAVEGSATLDFADGSHRGGLLPLRSDYADGLVRDVCTIGRGTIDRDAVVSVTVQGVCYPLD